MRHLADDLFDKKQLQMGMEIEKEHTSDPDEAKSIAKDHLVEFPDYYTRLKKMEAKAKERRTNFYIFKEQTNLTRSIGLMLGLGLIILARFCGPRKTDFLRPGANL